MDRKRNRLEGYDYSWNGYYFITICTEGRECVLADLKADKLELTVTGKIIKSIAEETPLHYRGLKIDELIVMPNHIHGIYIIGEPEENWEKDVGTAHPRCLKHRDAQCASPTRDKQRASAFNRESA